MTSAQIAARGKALREFADRVRARGDVALIEWYREGRTASRGEILESIESGLPELREVAATGGPDDANALEARVHTAMRLLPKEVTT